MGLYINPPSTTKEAFLVKYGTIISQEEFAGFIPAKNPDHIAICLMDNGPFTAAGIGYSSAECRAFAGEDGRFKLFYRVKRSDITKELCGVSIDELHNYMRER